MHFLFIGYVYYYAALLPRRGPHIALHSVCPSVCLSVRPVIERHVAPPSELQWHTCTFRHALMAAYRTAISAAQILVLFIECITSRVLSLLYYYGCCKNCRCSPDCSLCVLKLHFCEQINDDDDDEDSEKAGCVCVCVSWQRYVCWRTRGVWPACVLRPTATCSRCPSNTSTSCSTTTRSCDAPWSLSPRNDSTRSARTRQSSASARTSRKTSTWWTNSSGKSRLTMTGIGYVLPW